MLTFTLKKEWYEKIRSGEKTVEYREVKPYWTARIAKLVDESAHPHVTTSHIMNELHKKRTPIKFYWCPDSVILRLGYTKRQLMADITKIEVVDGKDTDLHVDKPVYAIHLANVKEIEE